LSTRGDALRLRIRAQPRASRTEVAGEHGDALKIRLAAPPVDGDAHRELIRFIARAVRVPASAVRVVSGDSSRNKLLEIEGADAATVLKALGG
jgi:uncharacterized protein (TIGR00251 family)